MSECVSECWNPAKEAACLDLSPHLEESVSHLLVARLGNAEPDRDRLAEGGRALRRNGR